MAFHLETERLILREWRDDDLGPFHAIRQDPRVMATLGPLQSKKEVVETINRMQELQSELGHCFWVVADKDSQHLMGWCGLIRGGEGTPVKNKLEIGWTLAFDSWGHGFATEAAKTAMHWSFETFPQEAVWSITSENNIRSQSVMKKLGMDYQPELDFDHPKVDPDSELLRHVTYKIERDK